MKNIKKPVCLSIVLLVLLLSVTGCKGSDKDKDPEIATGTVDISQGNGSKSGETTDAKDIQDIKNRTAAESWAYIYDKSKEILRLNDDGTAYYVSRVYENGKQVSHENVYSSYIKDDEYITLKSADGEEVKLRFKKNGDELLLYERIIFGLSTEDQKNKNGLYGAWYNIYNTGMYFKFSDTGTFLEDGIFSGNFTVDESEGTIALDYADPYSEDIKMYYALIDNLLLVDYPWQMVPTEDQ